MRYSRLFELICGAEHPLSSEKRVRTPSPDIIRRAQIF
jgi:hypothetical protein